MVKTGYTNLSAQASGKNLETQQRSLLSGIETSAAITSSRMVMGQGGDNLDKTANPYKASQVFFFFLKQTSQVLFNARAYILFLNDIFCFKFHWGLV